MAKHVPLDFRLLVNCVWIDSVIEVLILGGMS
jgi:hypothetical protein